MTTQHLYFNHAGTSWPKPAVVADAVSEAMSASPTEWPRRFDEAHQAIANFFGIQECEQLLLTPGCTSALAVGIGDALIPSGKRVLTSQWEHHALHRPLRKLASVGVGVEYIPNSSHESSTLAIDLDWLEQALSERDVALVAITAACNVTGHLLPYKEVIQLAHRYDTMVLLDAAQIVGWMNLDLPRLGADMVAFGGHKGLQAPWGIGGLYLSSRAMMECTSATCELPVAGKRDVQASRPGYCDVGSVDQFALAGLHAAVQMLEQQCSEANLARARQQILRIRDSLLPVKGVRIYSSAESEQQMPTLAFSFEDCSSSQVASQLRRCELTVGSGLQCAPLAHKTLETQETGLLRVSVGLGQADEEIDEAIRRMQSVLQELRG